MALVLPTLDRERTLLADSAQILVACDEVTVGAVAIGPAQLDTAPDGLADSKMLSARRRADLIPAVRKWVLAGQVGWATPKEIDRVGIIGGLRLAGRRAIAGLDVTPDVVLLDGDRDWLELVELYPDCGVHTVIKGDRDCTSIAAASVLAKEERDQKMHTLATKYPGYGLETNVGYPTPTHKAAVRSLGPTPIHRRTFAGGS